MTKPKPEQKDQPLTSGGQVLTTDKKMHSKVGVVDIDDVRDWEEEPIVTEPTFDQKASLKIAWFVLGIFGVVYIGAFVLAFFMLNLSDVTFDGALELVKFLISAILPIVTLAVGYYLGEKNNTPNQ